MKQFKGDDTAGPHVDLLVVGALEHLRSFVEEAASGGPHLDCLFHGVLADLVVDQLKPYVLILLIDIVKNVSRLDIPMADLLRVKIRHGFQ